MLNVFSGFLYLNIWFLTLRCCFGGGGNFKMWVLVGNCISEIIWVGFEVYC